MRHFAALGPDPAIAVGTLAATFGWAAQVYNVPISPVNRYGMVRKPVSILHIPDPSESRPALKISTYQPERIASARFLKSSYNGSDEFTHFIKSHRAFSAFTSAARV
ncbi:hypothetical protein FBR02_18040 [Anaerolineae bacterium CFX9]|nr:hypothetical protein [Anaerolineae bacterium CFX9]